MCERARDGLRMREREKMSAREGQKVTEGAIIHFLLS